MEIAFVPIIAGLVYALKEADFNKSEYGWMDGAAHTGPEFDRAIKDAAAQAKRAQAQAQESSSCAIL